MKRLDGTEVHVHERDLVLICGHVGSLPVQMYRDEPIPVMALTEYGVKVPVGVPETAPVHWMATCRQCGVMNAASEVKLLYQPEVRTVKDLRDDGRYFQDKTN